MMWWALSLQIALVCERADSTSGTGGEKNSEVHRAFQGFMNKALCTSFSAACTDLPCLTKNAVHHANVYFPCKSVQLSCKQPSWALSSAKFQDLYKYVHLYVFCFLHMQSFIHQHGIFGHKI